MKRECGVIKENLILRFISQFIRQLSRETYSNTPLFFDRRNSVLKIRL